MDNNIDKPIVIARKEFIDALVSLINEYSLPAFVIEPILKDILEQTRISMKQDYESCLKQYNEKLNRKKVDK